MRVRTVSSRQKPFAKRRKAEMPYLLQFRGPANALCETLPPSIELDEEKQTELRFGRSIKSKDPNFRHLNTTSTHPFYNLLSTGNHGRFLFDADSGKWAVEDMKSRFGVFVNGQKLAQRHLLEHDDQIVFGSPQMSMHGHENPYIFAYRRLEVADVANKRTRELSATAAHSMENAPCSKAAKPSSAQAAGCKTDQVLEGFSALESGSKTAINTPQKRLRAIPETIDEAVDWLEETLRSGVCGSVAEAAIMVFMEQARESEVDGEQLRDLTLDDLQHLGLKNLGVRKKLLKCISELFAQPEPLSAQAKEPLVDTPSDKGAVVNTPRSQNLPQTPASSLKTQQKPDSRPLQLKHNSVEDEAGETGKPGRQEGRRRLICDEGGGDKNSERAAKTARIEEEVASSICERAESANEKRKLEAAVLLQKRWRGHRGRVLFRRWRGAMQIQGACRTRTLLQDLRSQKRAAVEVQAAMRRHIIVEAFTAQQSSVIRIQAAWRGHQSFEAFRAAKRSAEALQSALRGRIHASRFHLTKQSAVSIQALFRANRAAALYQHHRESAIKLQAAVRRCNKAMCYKLQRQSSVRIQSEVRGRRLRQRFRLAKNSSVSIQAAFRGSRLRKPFRLAKQCAVQIQAAIRGRRHARTFKKLKASQVAIAAAVRPLKPCMGFKRLRRAAAALQAAFRARSKAAQDETAGGEPEDGVPETVGEEDGKTLEWEAEDDGDEKEGEEEGDGEKEGEEEDGDTLEWEPEAGDDDKEGEEEDGKTLEWEAEEAEEETEKTERECEAGDEEEDGKTLEWKPEEGEEGEEGDEEDDGEEEGEEEDGDTLEWEPEAGDDEKEGEEEDGKTLEWEAEEAEEKSEKTEKEYAAGDEEEDGKTLEWKPEEGDEEEGEKAGDGEEGVEEDDGEKEGEEEDDDEKEGEEEDGKTLEWEAEEAEEKTEKTEKTEKECEAGDEEEDGKTLEWEADEGYGEEEGEKGGDVEQKGEQEGDREKEGEEEGGKTHVWDQEKMAKECEAGDESEGEEDGKILVSWGAEAAAEKMENPRGLQSGTEAGVLLDQHGETASTRNPSRANCLIDVGREGEDAMKEASHEKNGNQEHEMQPEDRANAGDSNSGETGPLGGLSAHGTHAEGMAAQGLREEENEIIDLAGVEDVKESEPAPAPRRKKHPVVCKLSQKVKEEMRKEEDCVCHCRWAIDQAEKMLRDPAKPWASQELKQAKFAELENIRQRMKVPGCSLVVCGGTGEGKSTLFNALLGEKDVLPTNGMRACTASIVELSYNTVEEGPTYIGAAEFVSAEEWGHEVDASIDDLTQENGRCNLREPNWDSPTRVSWDKLKAVYGSYFSNAIEKEGEHKGKAMLSSELKRRLMQHGPTRTKLGTVQRVSSNSPEHFRKRMEKYMDSSNEVSSGQLWPLVKVVKLSSRSWKVLQTGTTIVDSPGVNDSNSARDQVVKQRLRDADGVIIVASMTRACDSKTASEMLGESFRRQLLMDGHYGQLCFIATKSDDFNAAEVKRTCDLPLESSMEQCAEQRKQYVSRRIQDDFHAGLQDMYVLAGAEPVAADELLKKHRLPVYCVSAVEYQKLTGIIDVAIDGEAKVYTEPNSTGIPDVMQFVHRTTLKRRYATVRQSAELLVNFFAGLEVLLNDQGSREQVLQQKARETVSRMADHVKGEIESHTSMVDEAIRSLFKIELEPLLSSGAQLASNDCVNTAEQFAVDDAGHKLAWSTYLATLRRDGVWRQDWNEKLSEPVFRPVTVQWEKVFCTSVSSLLAGLAAQCVKSLQKAHESIAKELKEHDPKVGNRLKVMRIPQEKAAKANLAQVVADATEEVTKQQRELSRLVAPHVQQAMMPCYRKAVMDRGKGVHERRKAMLVAHVQKSCGMFAGVVEKVAKELRSLRKNLGTLLVTRIHPVCNDICVNYSPLWASNSHHEAVIEAKKQLLDALQSPLNKARTYLANLLRVHGDLNLEDFDGIELMELEQFEVVDLEDSDSQEAHLPRSVSIKSEQDPLRIAHCYAQVYGPSGGGKSSMVNAVVGEPGLLPTNSMRACTATIIEVRYNPRASCCEEGERFRAEVAFVSREEWAQELQLLSAAAPPPQSGSEPRQLPEKGTRAHEALSKVRAAYGAAADLSGGADALMARGGEVDSHLGTVKVLVAATAPELRDLYAAYADSPEDASAAALWPLVKKITVYGPMELLASGRGVVLVDAPGIGDENSARDARVQQDLEKADAVWLCSDVTRAVNNAGIKKVITADFKKRMKNEGITGSLCMIATRTDVGMRSELQKNLNLPKESTLLDCLLERNVFVKDRMQEDFFGKKASATSKSAPLAESQAAPAAAGDGERKFELKTFTVSAREFERCAAAVARGEASRGEVFEDEEQTEIPALQRLVRQVGSCPHRGPKAGALLLEARAQSLQAAAQEGDEEGMTESETYSDSEEAEE